MIRAQIKNKNGKTYICPELAGKENREYEMVPADNLYGMMHEGVPLKISGICVQGFSMAEYRRKYRLAEGKIVDIAIDSVIDCSL